MYPTRHLLALAGRCFYYGGLSMERRQCNEYYFDKKLFVY